jgi:hypothetical protein
MRGGGGTGGIYADVSDLGNGTAEYRGIQEEIRIGETEPAVIVVLFKKA